MKNLKLKALSLGIVSTVLISSSAFAATGNTKQINKTSSKVTTQAPSNITSSKLRSSWDSRTADTIIAEGGTIHEGDVGYFVEQVQWCLQRAGYLANIYTSADGIFGNETDTAVRNFQSNHGLSSDGVVGPNTWRVLKNY
ncbi:peptidoglycan-binding domain-containing protein [Clostridium felsineum]|uniref:Uncharacterized protein n=1 Tax=Clostridium felsineum TaxID=36839 RepID=A0A1S8MDX2_9CLOT|nr:peptidoglycan-binding protein [Clostridium felsineum]URZ06504.1 hypothetical protein CLROS_018370 [Clostridium felsineum]URZ11539.1 hypothetical protein CROST_022560 [Clostridium felsineum]